MRRLPTGCALLTAFLLLATSAPARCETSGPGELAPGEQSLRQLPRSERAARKAQSRSLARAQRAEIDSLAALLAADPTGAGRLHREIEAVKRRHSREEIHLHREFAIRSGNAALARRLDARLAALEGASR